jgi:Lipoprotein amino terminal region
LDLILHSGSNVGIILIRDLILEGSLDTWSAARLVAYAGIYVKEPSEKLLLEFQQITEAKISGEGDQLNVFKNAAILAVASLVGKTCSAPRVCQTVKIDEWQKKYYDIIACKW